MSFQELSSIQCRAELVIDPPTHCGTVLLAFSLAIKCLLFEFAEDWIDAANCQIQMPSRLVSNGSWRIHDLDSDRPGCTAPTRSCTT